MVTNSNKVKSGGGAVATRGFLVQTLIALLEILAARPPFSYVTLEPDIGNEKFDFVWTDGLRVFATQVKSSANTISVAEAKKWAESLSIERRTEVCTLCIVGNINPKLQSVSEINGVKLDKFNLHLGALVEQAAHRLAIFIDEEGLRSVPAKTVELLVHAITSKLEHLASGATRLSRVQFLEMLCGWIESVSEEIRKKASGRIPEAGAWALRELRPHVLTVGRRRIVARLAARLRTRNKTFLVGPPGVGKSAIAYEAACAVVPDDMRQSPFPDGIILLDLSRTHQEPIRTAAYLWSQLAEKLGVSPTLGKERECATLACKGLKMLLVVDGAEAIESRMILDLFLTACPSFCILISTRNLRQTISAAERIMVEGLGKIDSIRMLKRFLKGTRILRAKAIFPAVARITEGSPLLLSLAGSYLSQHPERATIYVEELERAPVDSLQDPTNTFSSAQQFYRQSVQMLGQTPISVLALAGTLSPRPWPVETIANAIGNENESKLAIGILKAYGLLKQLDVRSARESELFFVAHSVLYSFARTDAQLIASARGFIPALAKGIAVGIDQRIKSSMVLEPWVFHGEAVLRSGAELADVLPILETGLNRADEYLRTHGVLYVRHSLLSAMASRFAEVGEADPLAKRSHSVCLTRLGDIEGALGNTSAAAMYYEHALVSVETLSRADPKNDRLSHDVLVSHAKLGEVAQAQKRWADAAAHYQALHDKCVQLHARDPGNRIWQREFSVALNKIGEIALAHNHLDIAEQVYSSSCVIMRELLGQHSEFEWKRDLYVALMRLGDVFFSKRNLAKAAEHYEAALDLALELTNEQPGNSQCRRDLAGCRARLADVSLNQQDFVRANAELQFAVQMMRTLVTSDPNNTLWKADLATYLGVFGDLYENQGDRVRAGEMLSESLEIFSDLTQMDETIGDWRSNRDVSQARLTALLGEKSRPKLGVSSPSNLTT